MKHVAMMLMVPLLSTLLGCVSQRFFDGDQQQREIAIPSAETTRLQGRDEEFFSVCFVDPALSIPDEEITSRVIEQTQGPQRHLVWKRAIISHASGGDAVPLTSGMSLEFAEKMVDEAQVVLASERLPRAVDHEDYLLGIPLFWSLGPQLISGFPKDLSTLSGVLSRLDFRKEPAYARWTVHSLVNKWVEVFDSIRWFELLTKFWNGQERDLASRTPQAVAIPKFNCAIYDPDQLSGGSRIYFGLSYQQQQHVQDHFEKVRIRRLKFGEYLEEFAYVGSRQQLGLSFFSGDMKHANPIQLSPTSK